MPQLIIVVKAELPSCMDQLWVEKVREVKAICYVPSYFYRIALRVEEHSCETRVLVPPKSDLAGRSPSHFWAP